MISIPITEKEGREHMPLERMAAAISAARMAQQRWALTPVSQRLRAVRTLRHAIAAQAERLAASVPLAVPGSLHRTLADTLVAEVLPLAEACRYLERNAVRLLAPIKLTARGRPFFLRRVEGVVERAPFGVVLVLGPANYPLLLPAVQTLQALVAGNAVLWKPADTGVAAAAMVAEMLAASGLPSHLVTVLDANIATAQPAMAAADKVMLTGHISTGRAVLRSLAETVTPAVMELSGCDAAFILPSADLGHAARAVAFGLRLNGSATCMAPRRLFVFDEVADQFQPLLIAALRALPPVPLPPGIAAELQSLMDDATRGGAEVLLQGADESSVRPMLIGGANPAMRCMHTDIFAPMLSVMRVQTQAAAQAAYAACPYSLTASIFGPERAAAAFARGLRAGTILINDIIVATADPRLPFSGRGHSGFGATRGPEGLLEMTAPRSIVTQRSRDERAYLPTTAAHAPFFSAYIRAVHSSRWSLRARALRALAAAARRLPSARPISPRAGKD